MNITFHVSFAIIKRADFAWVLNILGERRLRDDVPKIVIHGTSDYVRAIQYPSQRQRLGMKFSEVVGVVELDILGSCSRGMAAREGLAG